MLKTKLNYLSLVIAGLIILIVVSGVVFWPPTAWLEVRSIRVFDTTVNQPIVMVVDRTVKREFLGQWSVSVRRLEPEGLSYFCGASGISDYIPGSVLPTPLLLSWWANPECKVLRVGQYVMRTTWRIKSNGFFPEKTLTIDSNIFEVKP